MMQRNHAASETATKIKKGAELCSAPLPSGLQAAAGAYALWNPRTCKPLRYTVVLPPLAARLLRRPAKITLIIFSCVSFVYVLTEQIGPRAFVFSQSFPFIPAAFCKMRNFGRAIARRRAKNRRDAAKNGIPDEKQEISRAPQPHLVARHNYILLLLCKKTTITKTIDKPRPAPILKTIIEATDRTTGIGAWNDVRTVFSPHKSDSG